MHLNDLQLIIFDVDGTLLDSERIWKETLGVVGRTYHMPNLEESLFPRLIGISGEQEDKIYEEMLDDAIRQDFVNQWRKDANARIDAEVPVKKGVNEIFAWVRSQHLKLGVATQTNRQDSVFRLQKMGLWPAIDHLICGDEVHHKKPHPEIYQKMLAHFQCKPSQALVIEDSPIGIEAAFHAGIPVIQVPDQKAPSASDKARTIQICEDLLDVMTYLDSH